MAEESTTLRELIRDAIIQANPHAAFDLARELDTVIATISQTDLPTAERFERIKAQLMAIALRYYSEKNVETLFETHIVDIMHLPKDIEVKELIMSRLATELTIEDKQRLRDLMRKAMERSPQQLGTNRVLLGAEEVKPSVSNWIKVFASDVGTARASTVQLAKFFSQNLNVQKLSKSDKALLQRLIDTYEYLKITSNTLEGFDTPFYLDDEKQGLILVTNKGVEKIYTTDVLKEIENQARRKELYPSQLAELKHRYPDIFSRYQARDLTIVPLTSPENIPVQAEEFFGRIKDLYTESEKLVLSQRTPDSSLVSLLGLPQSIQLSELKEHLRQIFSNEKAVANLCRSSEFKNFILTNLPPETSTKDRQVVEENTFSPLAIETFLKIVFGQVFDFDDEESKWHAYTVIQKFPLTLKDFKTIVSYDVAQNQLVWRHQT